MFLKRRYFLLFCAASLFAALDSRPVFGDDRKALPGHLPPALSNLKATGHLAHTNQLRLAIGLPLRDPAGLDQFLAGLYDPASPTYRHYLTPEQFADRFGPTETDYQAVEQFAQTNGLRIVGTHRNRLLLDVAGPAAAVEKALHVSLLTYQHPTEPRQCFAPDTEPTVATDLPVADIQGLSDFYRPHPRLKKAPRAATTNIASKNGSSPDGSGAYFGNDFRNAYLPGVTLTGAGQMVGLLQFDGFYTNDIATYATAAGGGRANIPIQTVLLDGYNGVPTTGASSGNGEVSLDIEMTMAMAPGLSKIVVFEAGPYGLQNDVLNAMVTYSNTVRQLSSSWGWSGGPSTTTDAIFKNMAAAGQSFFNASGDSDAFTAGASSANGVDNTSLPNAPSSNPYLTQVGGTTLTMNGTGASYASETVWNWGYNANSQTYSGSSGGISSYYAIPSWQTNASNLTGVGGSTTFRNIPDVALTADNVYVVYSNGANDNFGGTSCAAPLWAAFMALVNQQAAANGLPSPGFINPAIYSLAATSSYTNCFHDVTTGNNTWPTSPSLFYAAPGYDLCTGLGTPAPGLIAALAGVNDTLVISPITGFTFRGLFGGPFVPTTGTFVLTNASLATLNWSLINTSAWLTAAFTNGALAPHTATSLSVGFTSATKGLAVGNYSATVEFTNQTTQIAQYVSIALQVGQPMLVTPNQGFTAVGPVGGPFGAPSQTLILSNLGGSALSWSLSTTPAWLSASALAGTLPANGQASVAVTLADPAQSLPAAVYTANLVVSNQTGVAAVVPFTLSVGQPIIQNGGFETGDFTGWTQSGNTLYTSIGNGNVATYVHSGSYSVVAGPVGSPGYLSQTLPTVPGQNYLVSLWLRNPTGRTPTWFQVQWNGAAIFSRSNLTTTAWTNLQFFVTASSSSTVLQFGFINSPDYFGLDDVNVTPLAVPALKSTGKPNAGFQLAWNANAGVNYQVQYKTNLFQTNWLNLGATITAATNTLAVTDTNAVTSPRRFYRLLMLP